MVCRIKKPYICHTILSLTKLLVTEVISKSQVSHYSHYFHIPFSVFLREQAFRVFNHTNQQARSDSMVTWQVQLFLTAKHYLDTQPILTHGITLETRSVSKAYMPRPIKMYKLDLIVWQLGKFSFY